MPVDVFISYVHEDNDLARQVRDGLDAQGISCWIASHNITTGTNWTTSIIEAINQCRLMIFILSPHSNNASKEVLRELHCADARNIPIVPLNVDGVSPVAGLEYFLSMQQLLGITSPPTKDQLHDVVNAAQFHLSPQELFKREYASAEALIRKRDWTPCLVKCLEIFESVMKSLLKNLVNSLKDSKYLVNGLANALKDSRTRKAIAAIQKTITDGNGPRRRSTTAFEDFTFPQMVRLYNEGAVFLELKKHICDPFHQTTTSTNWDRLEALWYQSKDTSGVTAFHEDDARELMFWTKNLLYESKILGSDTQQPKATIPSKPLNACRSCNSPVREQWHFCSQCGDALTLWCTACQKTLQAEWRRCPYCDTAVLRAQIAQDDAHKCEDEYRTLTRGAWLDGVISVRERKLLDQKRLELGLSMEIADRIERGGAPPNVFDYAHFVEGVLIDGIITDIERVFLEKKASQLGIDLWVAKQIEDTLLVTTKSIV